MMKRFRKAFLLVLGILGVVLVSLAAYILWQLSPKDEAGSSKVFIARLGNIDANNVMPSESVAIQYHFVDTGFGYDLEFVCDVQEADFLAFITRRGLSAKEDFYQGFSCKSFAFFHENKSPQKIYFASDSAGRPDGLHIMYDRNRGKLYGHYCSR